MSSTSEPRPTRATGGLRTLLASRPRRVAALAGLGWAVIVAAYALGFLAVAPERPRATVALDLMFFAVALILPAALAWIVALLAEELAGLRASVAALRAAIATLGADLATTRAVVASEGPVSAGDIGRALREALAEGPRAEEAARLARLLEGQEEIRHGLRGLIEQRGATRLVEPPAPVAPAQARAPAEPVAEPAAPSGEAPVPDWSVLVRALDFPRDAEDREGFRALRSATRHPGLAHALQAAEDLLTLLAESGVYMDDLDVAPPRAEVWRRYVGGARGPEVAAAAGVTDAEALEKTRALLERDPVFRDTAQHFLRRFDAVLAEFAPGADDAQLMALVDTRSARAFMLLARLRGRFGGKEEASDREFLPAPDAAEQDADPEPER
ncbi:hypothetical protein [Amaricoccus solimangrovi]|uniref:Uncharacterized protein n=1 Tax=Amaricoccus solimangrovi TaxID=2589815 RepID=A0A501WMD9_9RHOB|nr:hypothetical protein [Amaricoccus solimangrovi]TPE49354.1 hypothetical protein FJM51_14580 [Amaricoccus solimangrovi]